MLQPGDTCAWELTAGSAVNSAEHPMIISNIAAVAKAINKRISRDAAEGLGTSFLDAANRSANAIVFNDLATALFRGLQQALNRKRVLLAKTSVPRPRQPQRRSGDQHHWH